MTDPLITLFERADEAASELDAALTEIMSYFEDEENMHDMATVEDVRNMLRDDVHRQLLHPYNYLSQSTVQALEDLVR